MNSNDGEIDSEIAWSAQARTLQEVQRYGSNLEREVRNLLDWDAGKAVYDRSLGYRIQVDCAWPSLESPSVVASVTYCNPDTPGHSNENKLQLKVGELALLKWGHPELAAVLVLGGERRAWLNYVLTAFEFFFDRVIFLWDDESLEELQVIAEDPTPVQRKHDGFWAAMRADWSLRRQQEPTPPPCGLVRYAILDALIGQPGCERASEIKNEIARHCMEASEKYGGREWTNYRDRRWGAIEMSRSYFNPVEAIVDLLLRQFGFQFKGGLARDVEVPSLLHQLGMTNTKLSEDFILYSRSLRKPVYIQCKASGGGRSQHGKNIQNRTKEQVSRGLLYTAQLTEHGQLQYTPKRFYWIGVLDGDWGVTRREKQKYVDMLYLAGYDHLFCAAELLDSELKVRRNGNPLIELLLSLDCERLT